MALLPIVDRGDGHSEEIGDLLIGCTQETQLEGILDQ